MGSSPTAANELRRFASGQKVAHLPKTYHGLLTDHLAIGDWWLRFIPTDCSIAFRMGHSAGLRQATNATMQRGERGDWKKKSAIPRNNRELLLLRSRILFGIGCRDCRTDRKSARARRANELAIRSHRRDRPYRLDCAAKGDDRGWLAVVYMAIRKLILSAVPASALPFAEPSAPACWQQLPPTDWPG